MLEQAEIDIVRQWVEDCASIDAVAGGCAVGRKLGRI